MMSSNPLRDRKEFLKRLYESPTYRRALESAGSDERRKKVAAFAVELVSGFADALVPLVKRVQADPSFAQELSDALAGRHRLVTVDGPVSGTVGATDG